MNPTDRRDSESARTAATWYARHFTTGIQFALLVALFTFGGYQADKHWGSGPWGTIGGACFGFTGGMIWLYRQIYGVRDVRSRAGDARGKKNGRKSPE